MDLMEESHVYSCFYEAQEGAIESNYILEPGFVGVID